MDNPYPRYTILLQCWTLVFLFIIFLSGYFPIKPGDNQVSSSDNVPDSWRQRKVGQLVILVIDALRADFVFKEESSQDNSPRIQFLEQLLQEDKAIGLIARANPPTVTLPRLKSIVTGDVPGFVDVVRNFDTTQLGNLNCSEKWWVKFLNILFFS